MENPGSIVTMSINPGALAPSSRPATRNATKTDLPRSTLCPRRRDNP
jgi:hypothetical protein